MTKMPDDRTATFLDRLLNEGIKPHAETISPIHLSGGIAVVVYNWHGDDETLEACATGRGAQAFRLPPRVKNQLRDADHITRAWCDRKGPGRLFVLTGRGTFLVNFDPESGGYSFEPGSLDAQKQHLN